eukprot:3937171-Amphidinium_carterae.1
MERYRCADHRVSMIPTHKSATPCTQRSTFGRQHPKRTMEITSPPRTLEGVPKHPKLISCLTIMNWKLVRIVGHMVPSSAIVTREMSVHALLVYRLRPRIVLSPVARRTSVPLSPIQESAPGTELGGSDKQKSLTKLSTRSAAY